ncbi:MAG: GNAT family N-acetyltransferase [Rikenellaceae bacterium]|nr:GNAT family N-acetyltransferase [Rikenellaceae bacterium]
MKKKLRWERLCKYMVADPDPANKAAVRVLEKNGFIKQPSGLYQADVYL